MTSTCQYKFTFSLQSSILIVVMSITLLALDRVRVSQIESNRVKLGWSNHLNSFFKEFAWIIHKSQKKINLMGSYYVIFLENSWVFPKKVETKSCQIKEYPNWDSNPQWLISESAPTLIFNMFPINILNSDFACKMIALFVHTMSPMLSFLLKYKRRRA